MKKHKIGLVIVGVYLLISLVVVMYVSICRGMFCGLVMVGPIMPWPFILEGVVRDSYLLYFMLVVLNSIILYLISTGLSRLCNPLNQSIK